MQMLLDLVSKQQSQITELMKHTSAPKDVRDQVDATSAEARKEVGVNEAPANMVNCQMHVVNVV